MNEASATPLLEVNELSKQYVISGGTWKRLTRKPQEVLHAVDGVSLRIAQGEILGQTVFRGMFDTAP